MQDEQNNSDQPAPESKPEQTRIIEGYQPRDLVKGHDVTEFGQQPSGDVLIRGYRPEGDASASSTPPQGGSGVPPAQAQSSNTESPSQPDKSE